MLETMRLKLADLIPNDTMKIFRNLLKIHNDEESFERDISETLGFSDGGNLGADVRDSGMLGVITYLRLLERIQNQYDRANK